jgi:hypothetical protein
MDIRMLEVLEANEGTSTSTETKLQELNELQLALIGGGCGETVFH